MKSPLRYLSPVPLMLQILEMLSPDVDKYVFVFANNSHIISVLFHLLPEFHLPSRKLQGAESFQDQLRLDIVGAASADF